MGKVTLIGPALAQVGQRFRYVGKAEECQACDFQSVCHSLEPGRTYKIVAVRDKEHDCALHLGEKVKVVEIEEEPLEVSLQVKKALEGVLVTMDEDECTKRWCPNHALCTREPYPQSQKVSVVSVDGELECPRGLKLRRAVVELRD